jgi:hypothetical protein
MKAVIRTSVVATIAAASAMLVTPVANAQSIDPFGLSIDLLPYVSIYQPSYYGYGWYVPEVFDLGTYALGGAFGLGGMAIDGAFGAFDRIVGIF